MLVRMVEIEAQHARFQSRDGRGRPIELRRIRNPERARAGHAQLRILQADGQVEPEQQRFRRWDRVIPLSLESACLDEI
jgi:hypothetical protein